MKTVSRTLSVRQEHEFLGKMEAAGMGAEDAQVVIQSKGNHLAGVLLAVVRRKGMFPSTDERVARAVLGTKLFWGADSWATKPYNVSFTKSFLAEAAKFPWSEDVLNSPCPFYEGKLVRETHFAFLGLESLGGESLDLVRLHELHRGDHPRIYTDWQDEHRFAKRGVQARWHLMLIGGVPGSENKSYDNQQSMLPDEYGVPWAADRILADLLYFRLNRVYMDTNLWSRCQDETDSDRVLVLADSIDGVCVDDWDDDAASNVGVAAERKFIEN